MTALPRLVIAAPASGHGKTTVATGLMAALRRAGHVVSGHKVGPDYIDPGYHELATGRPGRNLDPHLVGEERVVPLLRHGARGADVAVVEGVMGLYDGQLGGDGFSSTAHVAQLTDSPVVLVVDISHASRSIAAALHGLATWGGPHPVRVAGVILNKAGSTRHADEVVAAIGTAVPVLGVLPRDDGIEAPSRHLGLVPAHERPDAAAALDRLAEHVARRVDLDAVIRIARSAPALAGPEWSPCEALRATGAAPTGDRPVVAVAGGRAFTFRYAETTELLEAAGCDVVTLDPLTDRALPPGIRGLYLGGGFPEMYAAELSDNRALAEEIRLAVGSGLPTVAECAGLLYLCRSVTGPDGTLTPMTAALDLDATWARRLTLAYRTATAPSSNLLADAGTTVTGHEFHRTRIDFAAAGTPTGAWDFRASDAHPTPGSDGVATPTLHAAYLHTHWAGHPGLAARFAGAAARLSGAALHRLEESRCDSLPVLRSRGTRRLEGALGGSTSEGRGSVLEPVAEPLRHHGDREVGGGLADFAVNVYDGPRPAWLDKALAASLDDLARYPDPGEAESAVGAAHGRPAAEVLATSGAAEAFTLLARLRDWRRPVVVHPQFTEPDAALEEAGHPAEPVLLRAPGFELDPGLVPADADLVVVGNPTNPTGVRHGGDQIRALLRPGRLVVVDEAFLDDDVESLAATREQGLAVVRSLTKLWSIPGVRAGYLLGPTEVVEQLRRRQPPWSVSTIAAAALTACSTPEAAAEARSRVAEIATRRTHLQAGLAERGIPHVPSTAPFVLARLGAGAREALRDRGFAVRRADTFPGLDDTWARIAVRPQHAIDRLLRELDALLRPG